MKTFNEILQDIEATQEAIKKNQAKEAQLCAKWANIVDKKERRKAWEAVEAERSAAEQETKNLYLSLYLLKNNARIALFNDVMPGLLEVLKKYQGKPYGEKTRAKVSKEVEEKTGARAYINTEYHGSEISVSLPGNNDYSITIGTKYIDGQRDPILLNNKMQPVPLEHFCLYYAKDEYITDNPTAVASMKELYSKALALQAELKDVCTAFNKYAVDGIERIDCTTRLYKSIVTK